MCINHITVLIKWRDASDYDTIRNSLEIPRHILHYTCKYKPQAYTSTHPSRPQHSTPLPQSPAHLAVSPKAQMLQHVRGVNRVHGTQRKHVGYPMSVLCEVDTGARQDIHCGPIRIRTVIWIVAAQVQSNGLGVKHFQ